MVVQRISSENIKTDLIELQNLIQNNYNAAINSIYKDYYQNYIILSEKYNNFSASNSQLINLINKPIDQMSQEEKNVFYYFLLQKKAAGIHEYATLPTQSNMNNQIFEYFQQLEKNNFNTQVNNLLLEVKQHGKKLNALKSLAENEICISVDKNVFFNNYERISNLLTNIVSSGKQLVFCIDSDMNLQKNSDGVNYLYSPEQANKLVLLNNTLRQMGNENNFFLNEQIPVETFEDFNHCFSLNTVIKANNKITEIAQYIKQRNLSPFEAMIYIHKYISSNFKYSKLESTKDAVFPGAFEGGILCSGYSSFTKAIIEKLNYPGLKCEFIVCDFYNNDGSATHIGGHSQCLIKIEDSKYQINGVYVNDVTNDSKTDQFPQGKGYGCCLFPVQDVLHYKNTIYVQNFNDNRMSNLIIDKEQALKEEAQEEKASVIETTGTFGQKIKLKVEKIANNLKERKLFVQKVKRGPDIVRHYWKYSNPIEINKYAAAIKSVFNLNTQQINQEINNSIMFTQDRFDTAATSCFYQWAEMQKNSSTTER